MKKVIIYILVLLIAIISVFGLDECTREVQTLDLPCEIITPNQIENCSQLSIQFFLNNVSIDLRTMDTKEGSSRCNTTFNYTAAGTYLYNQSNFDTGTIIVGERNMQFFNLLIFIVFMAITLVMVLFMHKFDDKPGVSIALGSFASIFMYMLAASIFFGFDVLNLDVTLIGLNINSILGLVCLLIGLYSTIFSVALFRWAKPKANAFDPL